MRNCSSRALSHLSPMFSLVVFYRGVKITCWKSVHPCYMRHVQVFTWHCALCTDGGVVPVAVFTQTVDALFVPTLTTFLTSLIGNKIEIRDSFKEV